MYKKNRWKVVLAIAVVLAFVLPGSAAFANETYRNVLNVAVEENTISNEYRDPRYLGMDGDIIIDEDFESDFVPFRWSMIQTTEELTYEIPCWWHQYEEAGNNYAGLWWGYLPQDEWLMTPALDLSIWTEASLSFQTFNFGFYEEYWEGDFIKVSPDGGETWDTLGNLYEMAPPYPGGFFDVVIDFNLSDYAGLSEVVVAFHRVTEDPNTNVGIWLIDDVVITAYNTIPIPVADIQTISGGFRVTAVIENFGTGEATDVEWSITVKGGGFIIGGDNSGSIPIMLPGDSVTVKSSFLFGIGVPVVNVTVNDMWVATRGLVLGPFMMLKAKNYVPADSTTINWTACTITVDISTTSPNLRGKHSVQYVDKDGNIIGSRSGITFTAGIATFSVNNCLKNKLNAGGSVNVR